MQSTFQYIFKYTIFNVSKIVLALQFSFKDLRDDITEKDAAEEFISPITQEEIPREWEKVKDETPGIKQCYNIQNLIY